MDAHDYLLKVKVQNNRIVSLMRAKGINTVSELSRQSKISQGALGDLINMTVSPYYGSDGPHRASHSIWKSSVLALADFLGVLPDEMFNHQQLTQPLVSNSGEKSIKLEQMMALMSPQKDACPALDYESEEKLNLLNETISHLAPREQKVINSRYGLNGEDPHSLDETGAKFGVTRTRISQIEAKAIRKMRHGYKSDILKELMDPGATYESSKKVTFALSSKQVAIVKGIRNLGNVSDACTKYGLHFESVKKYLREQIKLHNLVIDTHSLPHPLTWKHNS